MRVMGKRGKTNPCDSGRVYWQSAALNQRWAQFFRAQLIQMALSRFRWINLPDTCNARYLEMQLLTKSMATISYNAGADFKDWRFYSLQMTPSGLDMYGEPLDWRCIGDNGTNFGASPLSGVAIYDNLLWSSTIGSIELLSYDLADIIRTKQVNRQHAKQPITLVGDQAYRQQMLNIYKQITGNEPAIIATKGMQNVDIAAIKTGAEYIGDKLNEDFRETFNIALTMLGIQNLPFKSERQTADEIQDYEEPTELISLSPLKARRMACDKFNERFAGSNIGGRIIDPIDCVWSQDLESKAYNFRHNLEKMLEVENDDISGISDPEE